MRVSKQQIKTHFNRYRLALNEQCLSEHTIQCYLSRASQFIDYLLSVPSDPIDVNCAAKQYCDVLLEESYAPATVNAFLTVIETFLSQLTEEPVKISRVEPREIELQVLSPEQRMRFIASITAANTVGAVQISSRDRLLLLLLFYTGISIRQLIELNVEDLFVTSHVGKIIRSSTFSVSESALADEFVSLNHATRQAAVHWLVERAAITNAEEQALFVNASGQRITSAGAGHLVKSFGWKIQMELSGRILRNTWRLNTATIQPSAPAATFEDNAEKILLQQSREKENQDRGNKRFSTPIASA